MKFQFINREIELNQWTPGRWSIPIPELWEQEIDNSFDIILFPIQKYPSKRRYPERECIVCKRKFTPRSTKQTMCGFCFDISTCELCNKVFITQHRNDKPEHIFCSHTCSRQFASSKMSEWYKQHPQKRAENMKNIHSSYSKVKYCPKCKEDTQHLVGVGCLNCHNRSESKRISSKENMKKLWEDRSFKDLAYNYRFCEKCNKISYHKFFTCLECHPEAKGQPPANFITKDNVRFYKGIEVNEFAKKILSEELNIKDYPGINIRFGRVFYKTEDIITGNIEKLDNSSFVEKDNILYYLDKVSNDYVSWTDYKNKFKTFNIDWQLPDGFQIIPTFRTQDSDSWNGAKAAFEQSLVDLNIGWFVYIKFYISASGKILPLVVGKSGSLLVNSSGSDLSFSTDLDDGPARKFLIEENLNWCQTQIAILSCSSEQTAYEQECYLLKHYNLFGS